MPKRRLMNQINVVPYIDVMLVLLVIFMVTAPLITTGVVDLPSLGKSSQLPVAPLEVVIRADTSLLVREQVGGQGSAAAGTMQERRVTTAELVDLLRDRQSKNPNQPVVIAGDKNVRYDAVLKVMDELQKARINRVGLLVKAASR